MNLLNNFKHLLVIIASIVIVFTGVQVFAKSNHLVIVYPKNNAKIYATSTFFIGHTHPNAKLTINGKPVKVYANGAFVRVHNLNKGVNLVTMKSVLNGNIVVKKTNITVPTKSAQLNSVKPVCKPINSTLIVDEDEVALRKTPYGDRLTPAKKGMVLKAIGFENNHYKILLDTNNYSYIGQSAVKQVHINKVTNQIVTNAEITEDLKNILVKIPLQQPTTVSINNMNNNLTVQLHGVLLKLDKYIIKSPYVKNFSFANDTFNVSTIASNTNGYDYLYENNMFILKIRKPFKCGLRDKIIVIDAGHGGKEAGAMGPTEVPEKNINLEISKYLKQELEKNGATVVMTRDEDNYVDLYKRVDIAKKYDADILVSVHNNSLPDGKNPYEEHGTTTYYYHSQAENLANKVQQNLVKATQFDDKGIKHGSFVLTRPTMPVCILVEVGFMINPFEYEKLLMPKYQKIYALGIANGIKEYFK